MRLWGTIAKLFPFRIIDFFIFSFKNIFYFTLYHLVFISVIVSRTSAMFSDFLLSFCVFSVEDYIFNDLRKLHLRVLKFEYLSLRQHYSSVSIHILLWYHGIVFAICKLHISLQNRTSIITSCIMTTAISSFSLSTMGMMGTFFWFWDLLQFCRIKFSSFLNKQGYSNLYVVMRVVSSTSSIFLYFYGDDWGSNKGPIISACNLRISFFSSSIFLSYV